MSCITTQPDNSSEDDSGLRILREEAGVAVMRYSGSAEINALLQEFVSRLTIEPLLWKTPCMRSLLRPSGKG